MKRIEFIAPVEAIRGNLSGRQDLKYAENDNKAYESPMSQRNYARNYTPRFVGAKRAKDGLKYFTVRTKSAVGMTAKSKYAMALLGGTGIIIGYILHNKTSELYAAVLAQYNALYATSSGQIGTMRQWLSRNIRAGLAAKAAVITLTGPQAPVNIDNPWVSTKSDQNIYVSYELLAKFMTELSVAGTFSYNIALPDNDSITLFAVADVEIGDLYGNNSTYPQHWRNGVSKNGKTVLLKTNSAEEKFQLDCFDWATATKDVVIVDGGETTNVMVTDTISRDNVYSVA